MATRRAKKKKGGRPRKAINWPIIAGLCRIQCTHEEIASVVNLSVDTIDRACQRDHKMSFAEYSAQKGAIGRKSLRRKQFQLALKGDRTMLIWLGKQHLQQKESPLIDASHNTQNNTMVVEADDTYSTPDLIAMLMHTKPMKIASTDDKSRSTHVDVVDIPDGEVDDE